MFGDRAVVPTAELVLTPEIECRPQRSRGGTRKCRFQDLRAKVIVRKDEPNALWGVDLLGQWRLPER